ncbi:MAG: hypothetical protein IJ867_00395 [Clostridia bacterium]|nr:hypothetical protein [Clostridia bacterium]
MNKYDFDFKRIEDVLYDVLGIANTSDIVKLKMHIRDSLIALQNARNTATQGQTQTQFYDRTLDKIAVETDLETVLRDCIEVRFLSINGLEAKINLEKDTYEEQEKKRQRRSEAAGVRDLVKSVNSIVDLMNDRDKLLSYIDTEKRIIHFDKTPPEAIGLGTVGVPEMELDIQFQSRPSGLPDEYRECLEEAGIFAYHFGDVACLGEPNENGYFTKEISRKIMVGIIKKDEFGELKKYSVLMDEIRGDVPPTFYRDVLFSDMLLRNAQNNENFLAVPEDDPRDEEYGFRAGFEEPGLQEMLRAIYFESYHNIISVKSNYNLVHGVKEACSLMQDKMEQAINELKRKKNAKDKQNKGKSIGDDE